jgi:DNA-binding response OmpR family regulator
MRNLRRKLALAQPAREIIRPVYGVGVIFEA